MALMHIMAKYIFNFQSDMFDNMSSIILTPIHRIFVHFSLFWHRVSFFLFPLIKIITMRFKIAQKDYFNALTSQPRNLFLADLEFR